MLAHACIAADRTQSHLRRQWPDLGDGQRLRRLQRHRPQIFGEVAEVLKDYGYNTGAWGKWHNTPEDQITSKGPFDYWPTGYGFEYFYGFLAGEASQYEPTLTRNTTQVTEEKPKGYHLTDDIAQDAIKWLREQKAYAPDKPFFMYWAPGAAHGPHQIMKEWADKYKGKFDDGWDNTASAPSHAPRRRAGFRRMRNLRRAPLRWPLGIRFPKMKSPSSAA